MTERVVATLCAPCFYRLGHREELTIGYMGPSHCYRCGTLCAQQGRDFMAVWHTPDKGDVGPQKPPRPGTEDTATYRIRAGTPRTYIAPELAKRLEEE